MKSKDWKHLANGLSFLAPWLIGFALLTALPAVLSLYWSFCDYNVFQGALWRGLANYRALLYDRVFTRSLLNTFYYAAMALPAGLLVSLALALLLNVSVRGRAFYRTVIFLPSLVPAVAASMLWLSAYDARHGMVNNLLAGLHIQGPNWLGDVRWAMPALAFMSLWGIGYTVVIFLAGLQDVPRHLYEVADIDGAGPWRRLWHVTIPMLSPVIFFNLVMALIGVVQTFTVPYNMTHGGPKQATYFFAMYIYDQGFSYQNMGYACAMAWIQLLLVLGLTALAFSTSRKWVHYQEK